MLKLLVIADDFTGALDTGVQFSKQGIQTLVSTETVVQYDALPQEIEVLVLNTESRHLTFEQAYEKTKKILEDAKVSQIPFIYKKVDSALRGNISAELKAILDTSEQAPVPFLPAYPEMNRVVIDGHLYIEDVLVSESVFAKDPYEPVTESNVMRRLQSEAGIESVLVKEQDLPKKGVVIFDAQTDDMLLTHAKRLADENLLGVTVGCAGFAKILAQQLFPDGKEVAYKLQKPVIVVCGSVNPITKKQIEYVEKEYPRISLTAQQLLDPTYWEASAGQNEIKEYLQLMETQPLVIFETYSDQTTAEIVTYSEEKALSADVCRFRIGESLGKLTKALWSKHQENTFLFTGGDTLFQAMTVLGVTGIKPLTEIKPGVVLSAIEWNSQEMQVITKSGGFGTEELFEEIRLY
ncbi:four-carbon acid sugar kinase family protein [Enterococcus durans]|uniref:four-carbon acid sugar kinase family protein n=1 Tax=Enterococcus durans TaxID=53345 RepID=UPI0018846134|nr:four-carbon acid sugar kinase family protein [Enterococcus durans]MBE9888116.1 four-carbon acid sugar kinase family protein [Enterococcus durans]MBM1152432.1 four-carbon acid sugar kinase family protein [Enterococcus durans]MDB1652838.1 four-carbon acid sugar kinase family protein [Enterococcus durans]MDB1656907.1 four-carbon acid sugar kinase family protein [Enterococcus durans]MDB1664644.1 four-carbon acid sugar kinase family protein [Enterococcus durans]